MSEAAQTAGVRENKTSDATSPLQEKTSASGSSGQDEKQTAAASTTANTPSSPAPAKKGPPGGYDATPVPHAPPGYTVKITFHRATSLPIADLSTLSSDPYLHVNLETSLPKRHKEDPSLQFRTRTIWKTTEPEWNEEWYIANMPASGFKLKARIYDEDMANHDDRLGNVHVEVGRIDEKWEGIRNQPYKIKKRSGSKRAYLFRAFAVCTMHYGEMSGELFISVEVLGRTPGDEGGRAYTTGLNYWCKHYSPLLGRLVGSKNPHNQSPREAERPQDRNGKTTEAARALVKGEKNKSVQRYNFEANQFQLQGPVPPDLYHRYVEFRPFMKSMFTATGFRGVILSKALHHQHVQVYNFNRDTLYGVFNEPCHEMTKQFLDSVHHGDGGRIFTYVLTLDALMRFTETGKEFGIDMLSKHTMHSDRSIYIAFSGEFFVRKLRKPYRPDNHRGVSENRIAKHAVDAASPPQSPPQSPPLQQQHDSKGDSNDAFPDMGGDGDHSHDEDPSFYELIIDNDSGTYRPNAKLLPQLKAFLKKNLPGLKIVTLDCVKDETLMQKLKKEQRDKKRKAAGGRKVVYTQISRTSSVSSSDEERLDALERIQEEDESATLKAKHKIGDAVAPLVPAEVKHKLEDRVSTTGKKSA